MKKQFNIVDDYDHSKPKISGVIDTDNYTYFGVKGHNPKYEQKILFGAIFFTIVTTFGITIGNVMIDNFYSIIDNN